MVRIDVSYCGDLRCEAEHGPSHMRLMTDAPVDNQGRGEAFSPTDLVATALGTCVSTIMGIYARRQGLSLAGLRVAVDKEMSAVSPRRISRLTLTIDMPAELAPKDRQALERCLENCPVRLSLHPEVVIAATFRYPD
jgi:putative redox protein